MNVCSALLRSCRFVIVCGILSLMPAAYGQAQVGSELDFLNRSDVRDKLTLTETQVQKIEEAAKAGKPSLEFIQGWLRKMEGKTEEEKTQIRKEMAAAVLKGKQDLEQQALDLLDSRQLRLLRSMYVDQAGIRALTDARVAKDLALTEEQTAKLTELNAGRSEASQQLGFSATDEQKDAFNTEWATKFVAVLTPEQTAKWNGYKAEAAAQAPLAIMSGGAAGSVTPSDTPPPGAQIVSSFGSSADAAEKNQLVEKFTFNFRYAPWTQVLQDFAVSTGYTLDMAQTPTGTFSHIDSHEYNVDQTLDIMNGYLQRKGFTLVRKDGFLVCVNISGDGIPNILVPDVSIEQLTAKDDSGTYKVGENELVRVQIVLKGVDVGVMAQEVEALTGPLAKMTALTQSGILIISDTGANLRKINTFLNSAMENVEKKLMFKSYPLVKIDAEAAEYMLLAQFGMRQGAGAAPNVSAASGRDDRRSPQPAPTAQTSSLKVMSDTRTNSLFVTGSEADHALVEEIIKAIDVEELPENARFGGTSGPYLRVYKVSGRADQAALSINAMMPGVVVNEDNAAGTVHIFGTSKQHQQVSEWVEAFAAGSGAAGSVAVIPLVKMDPLTAAATLRNLFTSEGTSAPTVETDLYGNRIIVKGTSIQVDQIKQVLKDLGEDGTGIRAKGEGGTMRRYPLRGRDPAEFMPYLEQEWKNNETTNIRIVVPNRSGPIRDLRTPSQSSPRAPEQRDSAPTTDPSTTQIQNRSGLRMQSGYLVVRRQDEVAADSQDATEPQHAKGSDDQASSAFDGVQIVVDGDDLLLLYKDEETLDRLEETMDFLQQSIPYRTRWTVFYLQAADATEAAALLEKMITGSSVTNTAASSGFSFGSMFRPITDSVSNMTGLSGIGANPQTLRIIPDPRSNSLLVTGPQASVDEAEKLLEVLDSNSIPESLRDMQPRQITVEHADIDAVATMVKDVFKPYLEPAGGQQQQNNPLAALMGGGGGGGNGRKEANGVQMTVGVDRTTSTLFISSSEALFQKVEALVKDQDAAAKSAKPTVRYVQLMNSDATMVQNSLSALFPRVTSSAVKTSSSSTGDSTPRSDSGSNSSNNNNSNPFGGRGGTSGTPFGAGSPFGGGGFGGGIPGSTPGGFSPFGGGGFGDRSSRGGTRGR